MILALCPEILQNALREVLDASGLPDYDPPVRHVPWFTLDSDGGGESGASDEPDWPEVIRIGLSRESYAVQTAIEAVDAELPPPWTFPDRAQAVGGVLGGAMAVALDGLAAEDTMDDEGG
jgi:hypothetical protein